MTMHPLINLRNWVFDTNSNFLITISLHSDCIHLWYFILILFYLTKWNIYDIELHRYRDYNIRAFDKDSIPFDWGTRQNHGIVVRLVCKFEVLGVGFSRDSTVSSQSWFSKLSYVTKDNNSQFYSLKWILKS